MAYAFKATAIGSRNVARHSLSGGFIPRILLRARVFVRDFCWIRRLWLGGGFATANIFRRRGSIYSNSVGRGPKPHLLKEMRERQLHGYRVIGVSKRGTFSPRP